MRVDESGFVQRKANYVEGERVRAKEMVIGRRICSSVYGKSIDYVGDSCGIDNVKRARLYLTIFVGTFFAILLAYVVVSNGSYTLLMIIGGGISFCALAYFGFMMMFTEYSHQIAKFRVNGKEITITTRDTEFARRLRESDIEDSLKHYEILLVVK